MDADSTSNGSILLRPCTKLRTRHANFLRRQLKGMHYPGKGVAGLPMPDPSARSEGPSSIHRPRARTWLAQRGLSSAIRPG